MYEIKAKLCKRKEKKKKNRWIDLAKCKRSRENNAVEISFWWGKSLRCVLWKKVKKRLLLMINYKTSKSSNSQIQIPQNFSKDWNYLIFHTFLMIVLSEKYVKDVIKRVRYIVLIVFVYFKEKNSSHKWNFLSNWRLCIMTTRESGKVVRYLLNC